jgi:MshEN domain
VQKALKEIEIKAGAANQPATTDTMMFRNTVESTTSFIRKPGPRSPTAVDDGRKQMHKIFVDSKIITAADFDLCWSTVDLTTQPTDVIEPFVQVIAEKGLMQLDAALKLLSDRTRTAYLPLEKYDLDMELARSFPSDTCRRWCVLPIDRMSKSVLVATANPFNQQAAKELAEATNNRLVWYLVPPVELVINIRKVFR